MQGLVEEQRETHHIEGSVLHGKPDSIEMEMELLNTEKCENLHQRVEGTCRSGDGILVRNDLKII